MCPQFLPDVLAELGDDVGFFDKDDFFTLEFDLSAAVLTIDHAVPELELHRDHFTLLPPSRTDGHPLALDRLFFRGVGDVETAFHRGRLFERPDGPAAPGRDNLERGFPVRGAW